MKNNAQKTAGEWPTSALAAAAKAFDLLVVPPATLVIDGAVVGHGLPPRLIPLDELRRLLLARTCPPATRDAAWALLIDYARTRGPAWVIGAVGMALPALTRMAGRLCTGHTHLAQDIEAELLAGFLDGLRHRDLSGPAPYVRLCWMGWRQARRVRGGEVPVELPELPDPASHTPARPYGHPDLILQRAVSTGWISAEQAELISATRLGDELIDQIAARCGVQASVLRMRRRRGELALAEAIRRGHLDPARPVHKRPRRRHTDALQRPNPAPGEGNGAAGGRGCADTSLVSAAGQVGGPFVSTDKAGLVGA